MADANILFCYLNGPFLHDRRHITVDYCLLSFLQNVLIIIIFMLQQYNELTKMSSYGKKGMFYFNDVLNTFYYTVILRLTHGKESRCRHSCATLSSNISFYKHHPQNWIVHTHRLCTTSCRVLAGTRYSSILFRPTNYIFFYFTMHILKIFC